MTSHDQDPIGPGSQVSPPPHAPADTLNPAISRILQETQPWARFMGILGFVSVALMIVVGVVGGVIGIATRNPQAAVLLVVYPLMAVLYIFPSMYLVRYANRIREFVSQGQPAQLEAALEAQRSFWKFIGVLTLIGTAAAALMIVFVLLTLLLSFVASRA